MKIIDVMITHSMPLITLLPMVLMKAIAKTTRGAVIKTIIDIIIIIVVIAIVIVNVVTVALSVHDNYEVDVV